MRLRKKPVEIDGFQMTAARMRLHNSFPSWAIEAMGLSADTQGSLCQTTEAAWYVHTLEGNVRVSVNDWVLRGVQGELYPCKPDIVALTYDFLGPDEGRNLMTDIATTIDANAIRRLRERDLDLRSELDPCR